MAEKKSKPRRRMWIILALIGSFLLYGYAAQETDVDLAEVQSETRRASLVRIMRNLAQPNLITFDDAEVVISADVLVPCPASGVGPETDTSGPAYIVVEPSCANPGDTVTITGVGFEAESRGNTVFRPDSEFDVTRQMESSLRLLMGPSPSPPIYRTEPRRSRSRSRRPPGSRSVPGSTARLYGPTSTATEFATSRTCPTAARWR